MKNIKKETGFLWAVWLVYATLILLGILRHEIWMDEAHHWLVARDSDSLWAMLRNLRYEGHPVLWNVCLYAVQAVTDSPLGMQLLHAAIMIGAMALWLHYCPFSWWVKALLPFGYYPFFEYGLISRNYALAWLAAFGFASLYHSFPRRHWVLALTLIGLANAHLLGLVLAFLLAAIYLWEKPGGRSQIPVWGGVVGVGFLLAILQIFPPGNHPMYGDVQPGEWFSIAGIKQWILGIWAAFIPIPSIAEPHFWHTNFFVDRQVALARVGSCALLLAPIWVFWKKKYFLPAFYLLTFAVLLMCALKGVNYERFCGFIWLAFIVFLWISGIRLTPALQGLLGVVLVAQVVGGVWAYSQDWRRPFSDSRATAVYLEDRKDNPLPTAAEYCFGESLQAYLPSGLLYPEFPEETFCRWEIFNPAYLEQRSRQQGKAYIIQHLVRAGVFEAIWVHYRAIPDWQTVYTAEIDGIGYQLQLSPAMEFAAGIKQMEQFYLYQVRIERVLR